LVRSVTVAVVAGGEPITVAVPPGVPVTVYLVMVLPPFDGATHDTVACALPATAETLCGAPGTVGGGGGAGVTEFDAISTPMIPQPTEPNVELTVCEGSERHSDSSVVYPDTCSWSSVNPLPWVTAEFPSVPVTPNVALEDAKDASVTLAVPLLPRPDAACTTAAAPLFPTGTLVNSLTVHRKLVMVVDPKLKVRVQDDDGDEPCALNSVNRLNGDEW
jgi:hypothetical protein